VAGVDVRQLSNDHVLEEHASWFGLVLDKSTGHVDEFSGKGLVLLHLLIGDGPGNLDELILDELQALTAWSLKHPDDLGNKQLEGRL